MSQILAGDIGGTKTVLCLYQTSENRAPEELHKRVHPSADHKVFADLLAAFLESAGAVKPSSACFGIAGPIQDQRCETTNLPWVIDAKELAARFGFKQVRLLNDLEAAAYGMLNLAPWDFVDLNPNARDQPGTKAVIAAGTGLGEAILAYDGVQHFAMPTEGGHTDFAPGNPEQDALLVYLRERFKGHVSIERILAGDGFGNLYDFLRDSGYATQDPDIEAEMQGQDRNAVISRHGLAGTDPLCTRAMALFVGIYGAAAGNLALTCLPHGGLYIGGGIGPKIRTALENGGFMQAFLDKGRMSRAIEHTPVRLALNPEAPLLGAAHIAARIDTD